MYIYLSFVKNLFYEKVFFRVILPILNPLMMNLQDKLKAFDYVVYQMTIWYSSRNGQWIENDLSKLKVTKLLFFVTAITASKEDPGLLSVFDSFAALPYGHVESQIQDEMENSKHYNIGRSQVSTKVGIVDYDWSEVNEDTKNLIDDAFVRLKKVNFELISYNQFGLVELSHRWQSWKTVFSLAKRSGKFSMPIPKEMIMQEPKIFVL